MAAMFAISLQFARTKLHILPATIALDLFSGVFTCAISTYSVSLKDTIREVPGSGYGSSVRKAS